MTPVRPYHHGNLRRAVLDRAGVMLRDRGASELSLRELAGEIGVTHAAPRRYFPDRQALLDALAAEGFTQLGGRLRQAVGGAPGYRKQVRAIAAAYLDFATRNANLVEVMFAHKHGTDRHAVAPGAADAFAPMLEVFRNARAKVVFPARDPERIALIFLATLQGIAGLVNCGVVSVAHVDELIDDVVGQFTRPSRPAA